ncbi:MAG: PilT/PilU family type 4a pilus ATPase [Armatimonadetes bacterium]|nr:PilT/PilU family type 4a pilus ATPase [Armatimonadota bacterium]
MLTEMVQRQASDLHLVAGMPPIFRVHGELVPHTTPVKPTDLLEAGAVEDLLSPYLSDLQKAQLVERDLRVTLRQDQSVFHCQVFRERGRLAAAIRVVPSRVWSVDELGLPPVLERLTHTLRGLILVTGPAGSGKSTTVAGMIEHINRTRKERIITVEDPIQYEFSSKLSLITQRQVGEDVESYEQGLLSAMTSDLDVALIGELRDLETVRLALVLAETGHLVFSTLSVETVSEAVQRLIEVFPEPRATIRRLLARTLQAVIAQKLIPASAEYKAQTSQGRLAANEILIMTQRVRQMVLEEQTDFTLAMEAGRGDGMQTMDAAILDHYRAGRISYDVAALSLEDRTRLGPPPPVS